ncbi:unnamed protein product [Eruca vesicaria subsp. sativa]|uniref:F-box/LRR-repeat protein 15-like leucin rich repeat domain-containing protein n=1 Tax=Eruca vesicaria subsp. sativa TaxID=29727 RepID=A0ABC8IPD8_ERUVS|nr:unnamed protein product [Eruca vesicaria subsp. sativa]
MEVVNKEEEKEEMGSSGLIPNWTELTRECLIKIMTRLSLEQRWLGPMLVCKTWMHACQDPLLNSVVDLETQFLSTPPSASRWSPEFEAKVDSIIQSVVDWSEGGLKEIQVRHCSDRSISYVAERCPNLEILCIKTCPNVTDESIMMIASNCPKLKNLDTSYCHGISPESLKVVAMNCKNIEILKWNLHSWLDHPPQYMPREYLSSMPRNGNMEAEIIGRLMPQLKHLELRSSELDAEGLALICQGCSNLEYLDLYGCMCLARCHITECKRSLKFLKEIKIHSRTVWSGPLRGGTLALARNRSLLRRLDSYLTKTMDKVSKMAEGSSFHTTASYENTLAKEVTNCS